MKREHEDGGEGGGGGYCGKGKMVGDEVDGEAMVDELLAALGYKVRSSDMADVAQKLEQLEMAMALGNGGVGGVADDAGLVAHLASDTIHYNPSDLSAWLENMLSELNTPPTPLPQPPPPLPPNSADAFFDLSPSSAVLDPAEPLAPAEPSAIADVDFPASTQQQRYDLKPIRLAPAHIVYGSEQQRRQQLAQANMESTRDRKRMRSNSSSSSPPRGGVGGIGGATTEGTSGAGVPGTPVVVVDTQAAGIRLVHTLLGCAEAVQQGNMKAADALVKQISVLAALQGGAMRKVANCFAGALTRRIYRLRPQRDCSLDSAFADILYMHFYESCPYLKFAHFTANQAILEAFAGRRRVHVIDFSMKQGMQWPALMQALALRQGGPPSFRLTGIGPPQDDNTDALQQVGLQLAQLADAIHIDFEYRGFVANSLADLQPHMLDAVRGGCGSGNEEEEAVAVNSVFELHRLLGRPGDLEKVLGTVQAVRPRIVTVVEQEANHNAGTFLERFTEALHYYSTMFDSLEGGGAGGAPAAPDDVSERDQVMTEEYLRQQICNVVACEGAERTERHETLAQWRGRMTRAGFEPAHLGSNAFKQASTLLALFAGGDGYRVEETDGCLTLGWQTRPLIATSAWRLPDSPAAAAR